MIQLLNLLAAIALLVWGTQLVRASVLTLFGDNLRDVLARSIRNRVTAALAGLGVTAIVQSSTATALIVSAFVGQSLMSLPLALAVMLGADVGTSLMAVVFSLDLSWLSPLFILLGVSLAVYHPENSAGKLGRILIGLGLMLLALRLVSASTMALTASVAIKGVLAALGDDLFLAMVVGVALSVVAYSSLAVVLLTATLTSTGMVTLYAALGLVLGANVGSGLLALLTTARSDPQVRQVPLGNFLFKVVGVAASVPLVPMIFERIPELLPNAAASVVLFHLGFNIGVALLFIGLTTRVSALVQRWLPVANKMSHDARPVHLDLSALATPSVAISCAAREAMHQADIVENMLKGMLTVLKDSDLQLAAKVRRMDDTVDALYSSIKYYLAKITRNTLAAEESQRWSEVISFTITMEQVADVIERIVEDIENKKIKKHRRLSDAGMAEVCELHSRLIKSMRLAMSVFLNRHARDAHDLLEAKREFRELERSYAVNHLQRLSDNTPESLETSSLHIDLISDLRQINSHICSIAYQFLGARDASETYRVGVAESPSRATA